MRIKPGYILREVVDIYVIIGTGADAYRPNEIMSLNDTGAFLWNILKDGAEREDLISRMAEEYDVDEQTASEDVEMFLEQLRGEGLIVEY